jgi:hypothetical protein
MKEHKKQNSKVQTTKRNPKMKTKTAGDTKTNPILIDPKPKE